MHSPSSGSATAQFQPTRSSHDETLEPTRHRTARRCRRRRAAAACSGGVQRISGLWDGNAPYNVSGSISVPAYDLSKPPSEQTGARPEWKLTHRVKFNASAHEIGYANILIDPDHREDPADRRTNRAIEGWEMCHLSFPGPLRNSTDPVKADCSETLSPDCIRLIKEAGATCNATTRNDQESCAVKEQGGSTATGPSAQFGASREGWIGSGGALSDNLGIQEYDEEIRRPIVFLTRWDYDGKMVSNDIVCFGLDNFQNNSRTLADVLQGKTGNGNSDDNSDDTSDDEPENKPGDKAGDKPQGNADNTSSDKPDDTSGDKSDDDEDNDSTGSVTVMSWAAGLLAFSLAL